VYVPNVVYAPSGVINASLLLDPWVRHNTSIYQHILRLLTAS
jgi:hypothetical protein